MPGHGVPASISSVARPKQMSMRIRLAAGVRRLARQHASDVRQDHRGDHHRDVLDGPETQLRRSHGGAEVLHRLNRERTQGEIEDQTEQHLHVERRDHDQAPAVGGGHRRCRESLRSAASVAPTPAMSAIHRTHECIGQNGRVHNADLNTSVIRFFTFSDAAGLR